MYAHMYALYHIVVAITPFIRIEGKKTDMIRKERSSSEGKMLEMFFFQCVSFSGATPSTGAIAKGSEITRAP